MVDTGTQGGESTGEKEGDATARGAYLHSDLYVKGERGRLVRIKFAAAFGGWRNVMVEKQ